MHDWPAFREQKATKTNHRSALSSSIRSSKTSIAGWSRCQPLWCDQAGRATGAVSCRRQAFTSPLRARAGHQVPDPESIQIGNRILVQVEFPEKASAALRCFGIFRIPVQGLLESVARGQKVEGYIVLARNLQMLLRTLSRIRTRRKGNRCEYRREFSGGWHG